MKRKHATKHRTENRQESLPHQRPGQQRTPDKRHVQDLEPGYPSSYMPAFDEIEQRASERFGEVVRMIDKLLSISDYPA